MPLDPVDTFTRQARLSWAKLIRRVYEVDPLLCPFCGAEIGTRRRRRRSGAAASSAASLWAGPCLHHRLCHCTGDPPKPEAASPRARTSCPWTTARDRAPRPDCLRRSPPRSDARSGFKSACQRGIPGNQTRTPLRPPPQSARIRPNLANRSAWAPPGTRKRGAQGELRKAIAYPVGWGSAWARVTTLRTLLYKCRVLRVSSQPAKGGNSSDAGIVPPAIPIPLFMSALVLEGCDLLQLDLGRLSFWR